MLLESYLEIPPVTRCYTTACVLTTLAVHLDIVSPFQLYFNPKLIISRHQYWRLATTFLFFGPFGLAFLFNMIFVYRYCRNLEDGSFRGRSVDLLAMFVFGACCMLVSGLVVNMLFLGHAFTIMLVYVWSRRNPHVRMNFLGLMNFQAPYLPWVLLAFSVMMGNSVAVDVMGIVVGHFYYFLEDVLPHKIGGFRPLRLRHCIALVLGRRRTGVPAPAARRNLAPEDMPGGFDWQQQEAGHN